MLKPLGILALLLVVFGADPAWSQTTGHRLDLNRATLQEIEEELPVTAEMARAIFEYRERIRFFESAYDLSDVQGMTPEILASLIPLISTMPPDRRSEAMERYDASFRQVEQFLSREGASEELAEEYLDRLRDPSNVNNLSLYELQSFQNVSPVDAVAIINARDRSGGIETTRQLRGSEGLSYWAYRNLRDFVVYDDSEQTPELHGDLQLLSFDTPYRSDDSDVNQQGVQSLVTFQEPAVLSKLRLRYGRWKGGIMTFRRVGEEDLDETLKGFVAYAPRSSSSYRVDNVVAGNFRLAFGQGLVMDNTDFFLPRKTGYGWNKRPLGILGDLSRSHEYALRGVAVEGTAGPFHGIGFVSQADKDGILNADGSINRYILMVRPTQEELDLHNEEWGFTGEIRRDAIEETMVGGNLKYQVWPGTYVGLSGYEARYQAPINPDVASLFLDTNRLEARDSELFADYDSRALGKFRRVVGAEFQTVYSNVALQGEYAKLDSNPKDGLAGLLRDAPEAFLVNAYVQFDDLNVLAMYRDYDLGFDNPYARAFSQDTRYEQSLAESGFRMTDPLLANLGVNTSQMKPERGFFITTRYRVSRNFTITGLEYDTWERQADGQEQQRYTARFEYAPIFPLRFRLRQRFSSRSELGVEDFRKFRSWDTRLEMRVRLSGFDELRMLYSTTNVEFATRPRLSEPADVPTADSVYGQAASPAQALQVALVHHFNEDLMFQISSQVYQGFLWNFEDNEFVLVDNTGFRNWFMVRSRLGDRLMLRAKLTTDRYQPKTNLIRTATDGRGGENSFRVQLDYTF